MRILVSLLIMLNTAHITPSRAEVIYGESETINLSSIPATVHITKQIQCMKKVPQHTLTIRNRLLIYTLYGRQMTSNQTSDLPTGVYFIDKELFIVNR